MVGALPIALQSLGIDVRILCLIIKLENMPCKKNEITLKLSWEIRHIYSSFLRQFGAE